jgi:O-antigen/teichoic acid export membrane protein
MGIVLLSLWMPLFFGVLQGQQNFLWLGWSMMGGAIGRIVVASICVLLLHAAAIWFEKPIQPQAYAAGMMTGVLLGTAAAALLAGWHSRSIWLAHAEAFDWQSLIRQIVPLLAAFLAFQILFTADTLFVKAYFSEAEADFYVSAGTLSRALMWLVLPLAAVMFPRLVHSAAKSEKTNLMGLVLGGTAILSVVGALGLSVVGPLVVKLVYKPEYVGVASAILPWYASAMIPLALANVLLNNLLARPDSKLFLALCALSVAVCYLFALTRFHDSLVTVLKTLGTCNLVLFLLCSVFAWRTAASRKMQLGD